MRFYYFEETKCKFIQAHMLSQFAVFGMYASALFGFSL